MRMIETCFGAARFTIRAMGLPREGQRFARAAVFLCGDRADVPFDFHLSRRAGD